MASTPRITRIEVTQFQWDLADNWPDAQYPYLTVYTPGKVLKSHGMALRIETDAGITGEYVGGRPAEYSTFPMFAPYLIGQPALERERIYGDVKRALRQVARLGLGPLDVALWDIAGKLHNAPIWRLLGGYRTRLPTYASTYTADHNGGLDSPEAFADFAEQCLAMGYPGFKIHPWAVAHIPTEVATVHALGKRVGGKMKLMLDAVCAYETLADAVTVGRACDEENFFWYEDPMKDGGISAFAHRKLRQLVKTPILQTEHMRSLETHVDFALADGTDFLRADPNFDGGITEVMKIAHAAEGLGLDVELHAAGPAQRHCVAAIRNSNFYEMTLVHPKGPRTQPPVYKSDYRDGLDAIGKDGCVSVPDGPGLGIEYDWAFIRKNRTSGMEWK